VTTGIVRGTLAPPRTPSLSKPRQRDVAAERLVGQRFLLHMGLALRRRFAYTAASQYAL